MSFRTTALFLLAAAWLAHAAMPSTDTVTNFMGLQFKRIPAGTFDMGFEGRALTGDVAYGDITQGFYNEHPKHKVALTQDFYMGMYEVTNTQFRQFRPAHGSDIPWYNGGALEPANRLTWFAADSFCKWLTANDPNHWTYRLPTEAEWEYCCRAGTATWFSTGDSIATDQAAIVPGWGASVELGNIGRFPANPFGLYDMHGHAEEWCLDWLAQYPPDSLANPGGPDTGTIKAVRSLGHYLIYNRSVARGGLPPVTDIYGLVSFRVVISNLIRDSLHFYPNPDTLRPYQKRVASARPAPVTVVSGEDYVNSEGMAFKRVRMTRAGYPMQIDSVIYVSVSPLSGDSGTDRVLAGLYARRLSSTYGVLYRLSNRYEAASDSVHLTILPDIRYEAGAAHPDVAWFQFRRTAYIPTPSPVVGGPVFYNCNHNSFIGEAPNGDMINAWYSGTSEDNPEQVTAGSRLRLGENVWDNTTSQIVDFPYYVDYGSVFRDNGRGVLQQFHFTWEETWLSKSLDNGVTWSQWQNCFASIAGKSMFRLGGDTLVDITDGGGDIVLSADGGETWKLGTSGAGSGFHTSGAVLDNGTIVAFQRGATVKNSDSVETMLEAHTTTLGQTWTRLASPFYPADIGQYDVCLKLQSGRLLMASVCKTPNKGGVVLIESVDSGKTWFCRRKLDGNHGTPSFDGGYKDMRQGRDGVIHLQGTKGSGGGTNGTLPQASFTEQWLREGTCLDVSQWGINTLGRISPCPDEDTLETRLADSAGPIHESPLHLTAAPNPFNPSVRLSIPPGLNRPGLKIYNFAGALVEDLSFPLAVNQTVEWNAAGRASGLYFAVLEVSGKRHIKTLVLAK